MVAEEAAGQYRAEGQREGDLKGDRHIDTDREQNGHGAPGSAGGEGYNHTDEEQQGGNQMGSDDTNGGIHDELGGAQVVAHRAHAPGQHHDD